MKTAASRHPLSISTSSEDGSIAAGFDAQSPLSRR